MKFKKKSLLTIAVLLSLAMGNTTWANTNNWGTNTTVFGDNSTAFGWETTFNNSLKLNINLLKQKTK